MKRKCQGCNRLLERDEMFKITKNGTEIKLNPPPSFVGRSVYVCKNETCIKNLIRKKRISRGLKCTFDTTEIESQLIHSRLT